VVCAEGGYQPCLGVLGVPLITVPDSSPRASKGVLVLAWRLCRIFCEGAGLSRLYFVPVGARPRAGRSECVQRWWRIASGAWISLPGRVPVGE
jgi:hypothetical protein